MKFFRKSSFARCIWFLLALQIFNFSVDTPDWQPALYHEDLSINDMESVVEIVLEKFLGIDNAIPEYDESDDCFAGIIMIPVTFDVIPSCTSIPEDFIPVNRYQYTPYKADFSYKYYPKSYFPPPEA